MSNPYLKFGEPPRDNPTEAAKLWIRYLEDAAPSDPLPETGQMFMQMMGDIPAFAREVRRIRGS